VDLGRYLGRADALPSGRGRSVDRLEGTAELVTLAGTTKDAGGIVSLRAERLREVRVMVSSEENLCSLGGGRSPMELRRSLELVVLEDAALIVRDIWELSLGFFAARPREESLASLFMTSASALPKALRE
jgi:hypothetical protein